MRIIGLDLGSKTLGVAISDYLGIVATPVDTFRFRENDLDAALVYLEKIVAEREVEKIVLGLPKNMDGSIGFQAEYCLQFKEMIQSKLFQEVVLVDERLSSSQVSKIMLHADLSRNKRKQNVDKLAATVILQSYLDSRK
jgi:putative Holliday junction resolvase